MAAAETKASRAWRDAEALALETRAEAIRGALLQIDALDGMFTDRGEIRDAVRSARDLLGVEADNLERQVEDIRAGLKKGDG